MNSENTASPNLLIRKYILDNVSLPDIGDDENIFESGIVNSLFAIEMMTFLEKTFSIKVTMDDLDMENFSSVTATSNFVLRKKSEAQGA